MITKYGYGAAHCGALSFALLVACGGSGTGSKAASKPAKPADVASTYSIKAHLTVEGHPEQSGWVQVPPVDLNSASAASGFKTQAVAGSSSGVRPLSLKQPGLRPQTTIGQGVDGGIDSEQQDSTLNNAPGWSLLYWAATACYTTSDPSQSITSFSSVTISSQPWLTTEFPVRNYYIFHDSQASAGGGADFNPDDQSCDVRLAMQETLLCAADHLAQLADSPGTVTWSGNDGSPGASTITVTIPPQRTQDVFIARDMALNALAHLARLDTKSRSKTEQSTCIKGYNDEAAAKLVPTDNLITTSSYFDPVRLTNASSGADFGAAAVRRLKRKAGVLIGAARLTKALVEGSVQDDISGAQQQLSSSTDYHSGARLAWGMEQAQSPYNTLRHALRTVYGRLEIGNEADAASPEGEPFQNPGSLTDWSPHDVTRDDPRCEWGEFQGNFFNRTGSGTAAIDQLTKIPGISARWDDAVPTTAGENLALSMLGTAGIVFPPALIETSPPFAAIRSLLLDDAATQAGASTTAAFLATDGGKAFAATIDGVTSAEMSFALARTYDAFRLLTQTEPEGAVSAATAWDDLSGAASASGLTMRTADPLKIAGGIALAKGIPRDDLAVDPLASLSVAQQISSCGLYADPLGGESEADDALGPRNTDVSAFQNPFLLGESFRRSLANIALNANSVGIQDLADFAQLAAAEVKTWSGPGQFVTSASSDKTAQYVYLVNVGPKDLGTVVSSNRSDELADLENRLALVSSSKSPAAAANCAAGLRHSCDGVDSTIRHAITGAVADLVSDSWLSDGLDATTVRLQFAIAPALQPGSHLVLLPAPGKPGKVLAWLKGGSNHEWYAESYSDEQRTLTQKIFGIDKSVQTTRSCANQAPVTLSSDYCIAGMKRDEFVPLANELNSAGTSTNIDDSWKNYLDLADGAATKADQLGEELITQGLAQDIRKESAAEELGNLCGSYVSVDSVSASNGTVTPPPADQSLAACLNAKTTDIVFLRDDPFADLAAKSPGDATKAIRAAYCHKPALLADPPFCSRTGDVSHAGLNFHSTAAKPSPADIGVACQDVSSSLSPSISAGIVPSQIQKTSFGNAIANRWATSSGIASALEGLKLEERADGEWILLTGSRIVTGSDAMVDNVVAGGTVGTLHDVWPRCLTLVPSLSQPGAPPPPPRCSSIAEFVSSMFPSELGSSSDHTRAALRSVVEATVFYMGALAGELPANTIRMPLPVANRRNANLTSGIIPEPALYSASYFEPNGVETADDPLALDTPLRTLYTITKFSSPNHIGYAGKVAWDGSELTAMGGPARPFVSAKERSYLTARRDSENSFWLHDVYQQALDRFDDQGYLYVDTWNAPIAFDDSLSSGTAGAFTRNDLQSWLAARASEFNDGGVTFLDRVVAASFLSTPHASAVAAPTGTGSSGSGTTQPAPQPYQFCHTLHQSIGRSICTQAPASPVFHLIDTNRANIDNNGCDANEISHPQFNSTVNVQSRDRCLGVYFTGAQPHQIVVPRTINPGVPATHPCSGNVIYTPDGETEVQTVHLAPDPTNDNWLSPEFAAGAEPNSTAFQWATQQDACASSAPSYDVDASCPAFAWNGPWDTDTSRSLWQDRLKPSVCSPSERLEMFLDNRLNEPDEAKPQVNDKRVFAMQTLVRALGVSCLSANQHIGVRLGDAPPSIHTSEDINVLESWIDHFGYDVDQLGNVVYLVDVPSDVVDVAQTGKTDVGATTLGDRGKVILDLETKLSQLESNFANLGVTLQQLSQAIDKTRLELEGIQLSTGAQELGVSASRIENDRQKNLAYLQAAIGVAKAAVASVSSASFSDVWTGGQSAANEFIDATNDIATSVINQQALIKSNENLDQKEQNIEQMGQNSESQAVLALSQATQGLYETINDNITALKTNNDGALQDIDSLKQDAAQANIALAKAGGADFFQVNGRQIPDHVNTVYRRQFDLTKQRYQLALDSAKRASYLARLSIEQRLGVRLDELHSNIGPLEAPATWADDLCTVQGVDYDALRKATPGVSATSPGEIDTISGFANQFVGSYVDKLRQFVQFYNVQFPFVDSNDVAVISLREDLPSSLSRCIAPSTNLLLFSDALTSRSSDASSVDMVSRGGWRITPCGLGTCLRTAGGGTLVNNVVGPVIVAPPGAVGHATLLTTIADPGPTTDTGTANLDDAGAPIPPPISPAPAASVFQTVALKSGARYILSWWDMARSADGTPISDAPTADGGAATPAPYTAAIFDSNWALVAGGKSIMAAQSTDGVTWSDRLTLDVLVPSDGEYHVVFSAGPGGVVGAAVAIANVQLEQADGNFGGATSYQSNAGSSLRSSSNCPVDTPDLFRSRFQRNCDQSGCYFELRDVLAIDTQLLNQGSSSLIGKLADGNFNYRNNTVALNLVGTGVIDCSQSPDQSCNGSAYVQYDLDHVAYSVPLENYDGGTRCFDFGMGSVRSGKALASERFITLPMSSADRDLIDSGPFLKPELSGRPLSGSYRLRIHDSPQLAWKNVEDVQIVMNYGYWSRVARSPGN